jgi:periplasmic divalent cation tolerance protein
MTDKVVVLVTCGSAKEARRVARAVVEQKLAACVNIIDARVQSIYRWKRRVESAREFLLVIKTTRRRFPVLQKKIEQLHGYEVPEIIALPIVAGAGRYLEWIADSVRP